MRTLDTRFKRTRSRSTGASSSGQPNCVAVGQHFAGVSHTSDRRVLVLVLVEQRDLAKKPNCSSQNLELYWLVRFADLARAFRLVTSFELNFELKYEPGSLDAMQNVSTSP